MATYLRSHDGAHSHDVSSAWAFEEQTREAAAWIRTNGAKLAEAEAWILDIGYDYDGREGAEPPLEKVSYGGTLTPEFMRLLVEHNVTLWLSYYP